MTQVDGALPHDRLDEILDLVTVHREDGSPVLAKVQSVGGELHHAPIYPPENASATAGRPRSIHSATLIACACSA